MFTNRTIKGMDSTGRHSQSSAFTFIEVMIAIVVTIVMGTGILGLIVYGYSIQRFERERVLAANAASIKMEELKRVLFMSVQGSTSNILLDTQDTPNDTSDDLPAVMTVSLKDKNGNTINSPTSRDMIDVDITVTWASQNKNHFISLKTILAP